MSTANPAASIDIEVKLEKLRTELAKIPEIGKKEAKALVGELNREFTRATKAAEAQNKKIAGTAENIDKVGRAAVKARGLFGAISPEAAGALGMVDDLADGLEGAGIAAGAMGGPITVALAGIATALGVGYLAWQVYSDEGERAEVIARECTAAYQALTPILDSTRMATIDLAVATGELSETQGDLERNSIRAHKALLAATGESTKKIAELRKEQGGVLTQIIDFGEDVMPAWTPYGAVLRAATTSTKDLQDRVDALNETVVAGQDATREDVRVTGEAIKAKAKAKAATEALKDSTKDAEKAERALMEVSKARLAFVNEWIADQNAATAASQRLTDQVAALDDTEAERIRSAGEMRDRELEEQIVRNRSLGVDYAALNAARVANEAATANEIAALNKRMEAARIGSYATTAGAISDIGSTLAENLSEQDKDAAMEAYRVSQAAALVQAGINAVLAVSEASASAPYPLNIPSMIAAGAVGVAQVAAIASTPAPSFDDTPGVMRANSSNRQTVSLAGDDYFAAAKDPADLRRQVTGTSDSGRRLSARADDRWMRDHLRTNGTLAKTIRGNERVGHGP